MCECVCVSGWVCVLGVYTNKQCEVPVFPRNNKNRTSTEGIVRHRPSRKFSPSSITSSSQLPLPCTLPPFLPIAYSQSCLMPPSDSQRHIHIHIQRAPSDHSNVPTLIDFYFIFIHSPLSYFLLHAYPKPPRLPPLSSSPPWWLCFHIGDYYPVCLRIVFAQTFLYVAYCS